MPILDILKPTHVLPRLKAAHKKQLLQDIARQAASITGIESQKIFDVLLERERLSTTGIGHGIAIPHGRIDGLTQVYGFFAKLESPVDFDAIDDQPVDLVFVLLAPSSAGADHLKALAKVSRLLRNSRTCEKLRGASTADALYAILTQDEMNAAEAA